MINRMRFMKVPLYKTSLFKPLTKEGFRLLKEPGWTQRTQLQTCSTWNLLTGHWGEQLRISRGFEDQQMSSETHWLPVDTVVELQQHRHAALNGAVGRVAAASSHHLHLARTASGAVGQAVALSYLSSKWEGHFVRMNTGCTRRHDEGSRVRTVIPHSLAKLITLMRLWQEPPSCFSSPTKTEEVT